MNGRRYCAPWFTVVRATQEVANRRDDNPETLSRWLIDEAGGGGGEMLAIGWAAPLEFQ